MSWGAPQKNWQSNNRERRNVLQRARRRAKPLTAEQLAKVHAYHRARRQRPGFKEQMAAYSRARRAKDPIRWMISNVRRHARDRGIEFSIEPADIKVVDVCPVRGITLAHDNPRPSDNSASLDRTDNAKGYIPGNVAIISRRANSVKRDGTAEEHQAIADYMRTQNVAT